METDRILETLKAAVAYQLLAAGSDAGEANLWHPAMTRCLKRMIDEPDYRAVVLDAWSEIFEHQNGEMYNALREMMEGTPVWEDLVVKARLSALPTVDTQRTSKS
jgi:hypothetical protein